MLKWKKTYNTGNPIIDHQHRRLVRLINDIIEIINRKESEQLMDVIFEEVIQYTQQHFSYEEKVMKSINYVNVKVHTKLHRKFVKDVLFIKNQVGVATDIMLCDLLKKWLIAHIAVEDRKVDFTQYHH